MPIWRIGLQEGEIRPNEFTNRFGKPIALHARVSKHSLAASHMIQKDAPVAWVGFPPNPAQAGVSTEVFSFQKILPRQSVRRLIAPQVQILSGSDPDPSLQLQWVAQTV
jgi:hypothetical protein